METQFMPSPLTQWTCDTCGDPVVEAEGYVIWRDTDHKAHDFRIIHQTRCDDKDLQSSLPLADLVGPAGLAKLLSFLSYGRLDQLKETGARPNRIGDIDEFVDLIRRVQTPFYEQARPLFSLAEVQESMADWNEVAPYLPNELERLVASQ